MFEKKFLIIVLAAIIIMGFLTFSITKPEVSLDVSAQHIPGISSMQDY